MRKDKLAVNLKNEVFGCSASSPKQNNLVEIGNRKNGIQLKAVGSPNEILDDFAHSLYVARVRGSKVKRLDTAKIDTCEVSALVKRPVFIAGK